MTYAAIIGVVTKNSGIWIYRLSPTSNRSFIGPRPSSLPKIWRKFTHNSWVWYSRQTATGERITPTKTLGPAESNGASYRKTSLAETPEHVEPSGRPMQQSVWCWRPSSEAAEHGGQPSSVGLHDEDIPTQALPSWKQLALWHGLSTGCLSVCLSVRRLWRWCTILIEWNFSAIFCID